MLLLLLLLLSYILHVSRNKLFLIVVCCIAESNILQSLEAVTGFVCPS